MVPLLVDGSGLLWIRGLRLGQEILDPQSDRTTGKGQKQQLSPRQFIAEDWHSYAIALPDDTKPITFGCEIKKAVGTRPCK